MQTLLIFVLCSFTVLPVTSLGREVDPSDPVLGNSTTAVSVLDMEALLNGLRGPQQYKLFTNPDQVQRVADKLFVNKLLAEQARGLGLAEQAGVALKKIVESTETVVDMVTQIAAATEEQSVTGEEISRNVESISHVVSESAESISQMAAAASDMDKLSEKLQKMVSQFKTEKKSQTESWIA